MPIRYIVCLGILFSQLLGPSAYAEKNRPSYGVSNLIGNADPSLAAKVSEGTDDVTRNRLARSTSGQMNAEVSRLLGEPRRFQPKAMNQPVRAANKMAVSFPRELPPPAPERKEPEPDHLQDVLQKVRTMLQAPPSPTPASVAKDIRQLEAIDTVTRGKYNAQLPSALGPGIPTDWEPAVVKALLENEASAKNAKATNSDLSNYTNDTSRPGSAGATRLLDTLLAAPKSKDSKPTLWKPAKFGDPQSNRGPTGWRNRIASGSTAGDRARNPEERELRVVKTAPLPLTETEEPSPRSHTSSIRVFADTDSE